MLSAGPGEKKNQGNTNSHRFFCFNAIACSKWTQELISIYRRTAPHLSFLGQKLYSWQRKEPLSYFHLPLYVKWDFIGMCAAAQTLSQQGIWEISILTLIAITIALKLYLCYMGCACHIQSWKKLRKKYMCSRKKIRIKMFFSVSKH